MAGPFLFCISVALALVPVSAAAGTPVAITSSGTLQPLPYQAGQTPLEQDIKFRQDLGLRADPDYVSSVDEAYAPTATDYGHSLSDSEVASLAKRDAVRAELGPIQTYVTQYPSTFAGIWLDNPAPRAAGIWLTLAVAFTGDAESHRADIEKLLPQGAALELRSASYSKAQLDQIVDQVDADRAWHKSIGLDVYLAGTDVTRDKVLLGVSSADDAAATELAQRYGPGKVYIYTAGMPELDSCSRTACPPPWVAGMNIYSETGNHCTSGFTVQASSGNYYQLTAGHCPGTHWYNNGTLLGVSPASTNHFVNNSSADIQAYDIVDSDHSQTLITGTASCNPCTPRTMTSRQVAGTDMVGDTTCASGAYTGSNCGVLEIQSASYYYAMYSITLLRQRTATYHRTPGDSGGPVFYNTTALGSHVNYQTDMTGWAVYSHIQEIEVNLGMCMFPGC
jgi:hypothetical protein